MSYKNGMAAINLEMSDQVPRTEYSAAGHWRLVEKVTGIRVDSQSSGEVQRAASSAFVKAWDYAFQWNVLTHNQIFGDKCSKMGHAKYADGGVDFSTDVRQYFAEPEDVFGFDFDKELGERNPCDITDEYNANFLKMKELYPDTVNMTGIYVTCMSGLIELLGWDSLLYAAGMNPEAFGDFTNRYCAWITQYFRALAASDSPVVMIHDDIVWTSGAFLHPDFYRRFIFPNYKKMFAPLQETGKKILYTSDGNYTQFIDDVAECGVNGFVMEPCTDMAYIAERYGESHAFVGNADTRVLLLGGREDVEREVKRCMDIGKKYPGFIMAVGNHIPADTPVDNALWYQEFYLKYGKR